MQSCISREMNELKLWLHATVSCDLRFQIVDDVFTSGIIDSGEKYSRLVF